MVVRVGERIYRKIFPSVAAKHTYEWLESIPRPARHCLSSRKILQDCMVTIPAGRSSPLPLCPHAAAPIERRLLGAQSDACARIGTRAPRRPHFVDGKHTIVKMQIIEVMQNIPTGATDMSVPPRSVEHVLAGFDLLDCRQVI